jgi:hypothetical protein
VNLGEVTRGFLRLFLLINPFGHLEYLICETLESVAVLGLVLFLGVKNADAIQEAFKFPGLGQYSLQRHGCSTTLTEWSSFLFLLWPLDELG